MQPAVQRAPDRDLGPLIEAARRFRSAPVNLGVEWGSRGEEFRTSLREFLVGSRPRRDAGAAGPAALRIQFVEHKLPLRGFLASCSWHAAAITLLVLPIWGFLPKVQPTLQPPQVELTWYTTPEDLPRILLPAPAPKARAASRNLSETVKPPAEPGAQTYHPRQTILSVPVRVTHPRQTLIQPDAPPAPPKEVPALPNIVQWAASEPVKLRMQISPTAAAPRITHQEKVDAVAPEISDAQNNSAAPSVLTTQTAAPRLAMPTSAAPAMAAKRREASAESAAAPAPEISAQDGGANLRRLIALSATPAPPAPKLNIPSGNLAARISMSPEGRKARASGGANLSAGADAAKAPGGGSNSLPAAIRISGGNPGAANGAMHAPEKFHPGLMMTPFSRADAASLRPSRPAPIDAAALNPSLAPESLLSGKVYTMDVSMPNVTSASGSWIVSFAELDTGSEPRIRPTEPLSAPVPVIKVDPKYPPELIKQHVQGEVVLYAIIRKDGSVDSIQVVRKLDPQLDRDAAAAFAQWKFRPGSRGGVPVDLEAVVHIPFNYQVPSQ
jgi:TonB family protein